MSYEKVPEDMKSLQFPLNVLGAVASIIMFVILLFSIPSGVIKHSKQYREATQRSIEEEQDISLLKQSFKLKLSHLLKSNDICAVLLFGSVAVIGVNSMILLSNCWRLHKGDGQHRHVQPNQMVSSP